MASAALEAVLSDASDSPSRLRAAITILEMVKPFATDEGVAATIGSTDPSNHLKKNVLGMPIDGHAVETRPTPGARPQRRCRGLHDPAQATQLLGIKVGSVDHAKTILNDEVRMEQAIAALVGQAYEDDDAEDADCPLKNPLYVLHLKIEWRAHTQQRHGLQADVHASFRGHTHP